MKINRILVRLSFALTLILLLPACNLPIKGTPAPLTFPTPNLTLTAVFAPPVISLSTATLPAVVTAANPVVTFTSPGVNATSAPTATSVPPSPTPVPPIDIPVPPANTPVPPTHTPIPTQPIMRSGPSALAPFLNSAPDINGDWSDLPSSSERPADTVVFGKSNWSGESDLAASFRVAWDTNYLYLGVKVRDDKYVQQASGANLYKGDSIEVQLDTNVMGDFFSTELGGDDYQLGISPGKGSVGDNMEAYLWLPISKTGVPAGIKMDAISGSGLYRVEMAIPWKVFGVTPTEGMHFGFAVSVSDNDISGTYQQTMVSSAPNRSLVDPTTWGDLTLK
jgi:Carbohydrate family 9 binding domain-like